jgi:hypothetical protein
MVKKNTERFFGSNLQCCLLYATVLLAVWYSAELNKYVLLVRTLINSSNKLLQTISVLIYLFLENDRQMVGL